MNKESKKGLGIGLAVGIITCILVLGILFVMFVIRMFMGEQTIITDVAKYEETLEEYTDAETDTGFIVFPEIIPENATDVDFYCSHEIFFVGSAIMEVYLQCTYDESDYQAEIERLENTYKQYGATRKELLYVEDRFAYPAYMAVDGHSGEYEYALLTREKQITYVFTSFFREEGMEKIPKEYMPYEFEDMSRTLEETVDNYSIYFVRWDEEIGSYEYDYSRDSLVAVEEHYYARVGYNVFYVNTYLDENDVEIIRDCSYMYYKSKYDSIYGLPEEIFYTELAGCRLKSLELNKEKTIATVTYYDGEEEKVMEYEIPDV